MGLALCGTYLIGASDLDEVKESIIISVEALCMKGGVA
jgi:hypothetical protein